MNIKGIYTALVTPFHRGEIDYDSLDAICKHQIESGVDGLVLLGTTGESPTITSKEREALISHVIKNYQSKINIVVGTGSNNTIETIEKTQQAKELGVKTVMVVNPYYNKPNQEGLRRHFLAVADACDIDMMLYNIEGRTGVNLLPETICELGKHPRIVAIKEASGRVGQMLQVISENEMQMSVMCGDDGLACPIMMMGGRGVVSVASNIIPKEMVKMSEALQKGDFETGRSLHYSMETMFKTLFMDVNPVVVKEAMAMVGLIKDGEVRMPLYELGEANRLKLQSVLKEYELL